MKKILFLSLSLLFFSCGSIPKEAPKLSQELGTQLENMEASHLHLVHLYFENKRMAIQNFLDQEWTPLFVQNFFDEPDIANTWIEIVEDDDRENRLEFIKLVMPGIQEQVNRKYMELNRPLDSLEDQLVAAIQGNYRYMARENESLTALLRTKSEAARFKVTDLYALDFVQKPVDQIFSKIDHITAEALQGTGKLEEMENRFEDLKGGLNHLLSTSF